MYTFAHQNFAWLMSSTKTIEHTGIVKNIGNDSIIVGIIKNSGCASCEAKGYCSASEVEEKEIEIRHSGKGYSIGEQVLVYFNESLGYRALFLGYVLPFILILFLLIILSNYGADEGEAGLISLGALVPYYLIIFIFRNRLKKTFTFSIKKLIDNELYQTCEQFS